MVRFEKGDYFVQITVLKSFRLYWQTVVDVCHISLFSTLLYSLLYVKVCGTLRQSKTMCWLYISSMQQRFVLDLSCVRCIDDLCADDNGVWMHGGKPRRKYCIEHDSDTCEIISAEPLDGEPTLNFLYFHIGETLPSL